MRPRPLKNSEMSHIEREVSRPSYAIGLMVSSSLVISFTGLIVRSIDVGPLVMNFYRSMSLMVAVIIILVFKYRQRVFSQVRRIGWTGMMAAILHAGAAIFFLQSLTHTTVANTLFVLGAIPFFAAILAWVFLREQPARPTVIAMIAAFIGIAVMLGEGLGSGSVYGNLTALLAALCFAGYAVLMRRNRHIDMLPTLLVSMLLIMAVAGAVRSGMLNISAADLILCIAWGGVLSGFTSICFVIASRHIAAAEVTVLMLLEFSLGPLWVWMFVHEVPSRWTLFGGGLVMLAVLSHAWVSIAQQHRYRRPFPS